ncbi:MAG: VOC family protein [Deltaproteobacteria bacterium]|nr:VOC family protein [Deltaproteobacteria bacterium]
MALAVHHLAVLVEDLERAERFYVGLLGLPVLKRWSDDQGAARSIWVELDGGFLALERASPGGARRDAMGVGWHLLALRISADRRAWWRSTLVAAGTAIERESPYTLYFRDPDGNLLGLSHHPEAAELEPLR